MKKELQEQLFDKYPVLFERRNLSMRESCLSFGIQTDNGWYGLLSEFCEKLEKLRLTSNPDVRIEQVKEKFGRLTIYIDNSTEDSRQLTVEYGNKSYHVCEVTGKEGTLCVRNGWLKVLSNEEAENVGAKPYNINR